MTIRTALRLAPTLIAVLLLQARSAQAQSIVKQPGNHPDYSFELEPHFVFQWANRVGPDDDGVGAGIRANIPFLRNGPIRTINNNMAITFGLDVTFGDIGYGWCTVGRPDRRLADEDCDATEFWAPVGVQWNFFLTKVISVFGEMQFAIVHRRWDYPYDCAGTICDADYDDTDAELVASGGGRFMFSNNVGATVRLGFPMITAGINILF